MSTAVYLFTGFIDSGKTTMLTDTVVDQEFAEGNKSLVIVCEDGDVKYDAERFAKVNTSVVMIEEESDLTEERLEEFDQVYRPRVVFIEYNGTWKASTLWDLSLPKGWEIVQQLTTIDASTYELYLTNMRIMMMEQVIHSDMVIFNRCNDDTPKGRFRRIVCARNSRAQIFFEMEDGTLDDTVTETLPYNVNQDMIEISDQDYGIFYFDLQYAPDKYIGRTVRFLAQFFWPNEKNNAESYFFVGRYAMVCCAQDIQFLSLKCKYEDAPQLSDKDWGWFTVEIRKEFVREYFGRETVLYLKKVEPTKEPEESMINLV